MWLLSQLDVIFFLHFIFFFLFYLICLFFCLLLVFMYLKSQSQSIFSFLTFLSFVVCSPAVEASAEANPGAAGGPGHHAT